MSNTSAECAIPASPGKTAASPTSTRGATLAPVFPAFLPPPFFCFFLDFTSSSLEAPFARFFPRSLSLFFLRPSVMK